MKKERPEELPERDRRNRKRNLKNETTQSILAIISFLVGAILIFASFGKAGIVGKNTFGFLSFLFGTGYFLLPILCFMMAFSFMKELEQRFSMLKIFGGGMFFVASLSLLEIGFPEKGGRVGVFIAKPLIALFDVASSVVLLSALILISVLVLFDTHLKGDLFTFWRKLNFGKKEKDADVAIVNGDEESENEEAEKVNKEIKKPEKEELPKKESRGFFAPKPKDDEVDEMFKAPLILKNRSYTPPPLSLLESDKGKPGVGDIKANANIIKRTLQNFGIVVEMDEVTIGPTVTRYAMKPAEGVKLSKIVGLQDNLALALAAETIRIEAPIPGKSLVGIEVPNTSKTTVGLGSLIASKEFQGSEKPLLTAIGKDVSGKPTLYDLAKMPHLLIAGTTGSGKSVAVHSILNSLLYRNSPDLLKFIMVDAKRVELTLYNKIPHLLTPVITDAKKTILALKWAAKEMDRRYDVLEKESVRDIHSYHKNIVEPAVKSKKENQPETMPYIVIVIDELADLMQAYPRELEASIVRLAQMSRAVGIHLILSTQRPSVNVITGLIKANIPTRIALKVGSQIDSRTIIDRAGAEKLVGQGDLLFVTQDRPEPVRIQSPFISENEVKKVVKYLVDAFIDEIPEQGLDLNPTNPEQVEGKNSIFDESVLSGDEADDDDLYEEAKSIVIEAKKASTSYIQRKLRVGYARAARLMDILEERGVIGPADGARPREVLGNGGNNSSNENI